MPAASLVPPMSIARAVSIGGSLTASPRGGGGREDRPTPSHRSMFAPKTVPAGRGKMASRIPGYGLSAPPPPPRARAARSGPHAPTPPPPPPPPTPPQPA